MLNPAPALTQTDLAIAVKGLTKIYPNGKQALHGIDLAIPRGRIFGLLGPNGAGKSTFINILAGLVTKTAGSVSVWGFDIDQNPRNAKLALGVVPQELTFDAFFTPREALELHAGLFGVPRELRWTEDILRAVRLFDKADAYARTLSGGMKRRLLVAKALVHRPPVLILDEPTAGVDIELRQQLWDYVRELNRAGVTIVLTTHYLEEAEELCDSIAIINQGRVVACESTAALLGRVDEKELIVTLDRPLDQLPPALAGQATLTAPDTLLVHYSAGAAPLDAVLAALRAGGVGIRDLTTRQSDLEDIFLQLTSGSHAGEA